MTGAPFAHLPPSFAVRFVRYSVDQKGFHPRDGVLATTLLDEMTVRDDAPVATSNAHGAAVGPTAARWAFRTTGASSRTVI